MDFKTVRQKMMVNETVYNATGELPIDVDFDLPDFYPEIIKILKCKVVPRINSKNINGTNVDIDGHICISLLYADKNGCIKNYEHVTPFSKTFETNEDISGAMICCKAKQEYMNCRALTERKATVHGAYSLTINIKSKKQHDIIVSIDDDTVQTNSSECTFLNAIGNAEKNYIIEQELDLSEGQKTIDCIVRCDAFPVITEIKPVHNKASVKGNLTLSLLYTSGEQCVPYKSVIPFNQFIDIDGISEECACTGKVQLCYLEVKPRSVDGEWRSMMLNAKLLISVETFCEGEVPVICDAYSTKYKLNMEQLDVSLEKIIGHISDNFMFKKNIELPGGALGNIIDVWSETDVDSSNTSNGIITLKGYVTICVLAYDVDGKTCYYEKKTDFSFEKNVDFNYEGQLVCSPVIEPISSSYTILSDTCLEYRTEYRINMSFSEEKKVSLLTDIFSDSENNKENREFAMIVYFAGKNESVWDIAKKYNSNIKEVKEINQIEGDLLKTDKKLLIPVS